MDIWSDLVMEISGAEQYTVEGFGDPNNYFYLLEYNSL